MKIIIIGGGLYGAGIAEALINKKHDIVIIDKDPNRIEYINSNLDVLAIKGSGADINVLYQAGVTNADMLISMSDSDEVNIVSSIIAKHCNVKTNIVRISDTNFNLVPQDMQNLWKNLGIDFIINPEMACASEFESAIILSGIVEEISISKHKVIFVGCKIGAKASLINIALKDLHLESVFQGIRFVAIERENKVIIPRGNDKILEKDIVYFMCDKKMMKDILIWLDVVNYLPERVIINGASDVGIALAQLLETHKIDVKLIEKNSESASFASEKLKKTMVFHGEPTEETLLESMDIADVDAFVSVTNDDESNMLSCLVAKQMLSKKTFALIKKSEYADLVSAVMKINRVINPKKVTINSILKFIRKGNIEFVDSLSKFNAELMELVVDENSKAVGKKILDLNFPEDAIIGAIINNNNMIFATGDYIIKSGDCILIFLFSSAVSKVENIFAKKLFKIF